MKPVICLPPDHRYMVIHTETGQILYLAKKKHLAFHFLWGFGEGALVVRLKRCRDKWDPKPTKPAK